MTISAIRTLIEQHNPQSFDDLYKLFNKNIEHVMIGTYILGLSNEFISNIYNQIEKDEDEILELVEKYHQDEKILYFLMPKTVQAALVLFTYYQEQDFTLMSSMIVNQVKDRPEYLDEIIDADVFEHDIFFFSSHIDLKSDNLEGQLSGKIKNMDLIFSEPFYRNLLLHFELARYLVLSKASLKDLNLVIKDYYQDIIKDFSLKLQAQVLSDKIEVHICTIDLVQFFYDLKEFNMEKVFDQFIQEVKGEFQDELLENSFKLVLAQQTGIGMVDLGVKALKIFLKSFQTNSSVFDSQLDLNSVEKNYVDFKGSGHHDVRDWFVLKMQKEFELVNKSFFKETLHLNYDFFNKQYNNFIEKYIYIFVQNGGITKDIISHTEIFEKVYDQVVLLKDMDYSKRY